MARRLLRIMAWCVNCDWELESRNAEGVAAQHARKYGHKTEGEITYTFVIEGAA